MGTVEWNQSHCGNGELNEHELHDVVARAKGRGSMDDMAGDRRRSEVRQGGSGRPRRGCFVGRRGV